MGKLSNAIVVGGTKTHLSPGLGHLASHELSPRTPRPTEPRLRTTQGRLELLAPLHQWRFGALNHAELESVPPKPTNATSSLRLLLISSQKTSSSSSTSCTQYSLLQLTLATAPTTITITTTTPTFSFAVDNFAAHSLNSSGIRFTQTLP